MALTPRNRAGDRRIPVARRRRPLNPWSSCAGLLASAAVLALVGCAASGPAPEATGLPAGVTVELVQLRSDVAARQAQVQVRNGGDETLVIGEVRVADGRFADAAARPVARESRVPAGQTVDLRIQLPEMACPGDADGGTTLTIDLGASGGLVTAPLGEAVPFLADLHERECRAQALAAAASVTFASFTPSPAGEPAELVLEVRPTGEGAARLDGIRTTNLLTFGMGEAVETYPLDIAVDVGDSEVVTRGLPLVPFRCDAHAVQEDKRGTVFTVAVEVDGEPGEIELAAPEDMRGRILTWVADWCGFGG